MQDDNKRTSATNTGNDKGKNEQRGNNEKSGMEKTEIGLLHKKIERSGLRSAEPEGEERVETLGWGLAKVWNKSLEETETRPTTARARLWASEIGKPYIDTYLKMKGVEPTNPPNARSLRKFEAGAVFEWIVSLVLKRANILKESQNWCEHQYQNMLPVTGKADFIAGGKVDISKGKEFIAFLERAEVPEVFLRCFNKTIDYLAETYPNGLEEQPLEVKSISSFASDMMEKNDKPIRNHRTQIFHYLKAMNYKKGRLVYICRDDLRMFEYTVLNPSFVEDEYKNWIERMSEYYYKDQEPPLEKMIIWDEESGKFMKNLQVEWSPYLTKLYGFKTSREFSEKYGTIPTNWNRVLKRVKDKKKMTDKNLEILEEIKKEGYSPEDLVKYIPDNEQSSEKI